MTITVFSGHLTSMILFAGSTILAFAASGPGALSQAALSPATLSPVDDTAIRHLAGVQEDAWNRGDAVAWGKSFTEDATFTNVRGSTVTGRAQIAALHAKIFTTFYKGSHLVEKVTRITVLGPGAAVLEVDATVSGYQSLPPGIAEPADKLLRTHMLQVLVKTGDDWKVTAFSNVTILPPLPQPPAPAKP